ncbi:MAG TPA: magnesium/cobalt transporter CorA [Gemmatimonadales bacterium]|nr:magnesium/cobalt transporter CorA [Gemmatimonadales bacterium]
MIYGPDGVEERSEVGVGDLPAVVGTDRVTWIDVQGLGDEAVLRRLAEIFEIHRLALEDVVNVPQRPKAEAYDRQHLVITRMIRAAAEGQLDVEQVSLFIGPHYLLSIQERRGDVFDPVRVRIRAGKELIRKSGPDYLAYALIDAILDGYYPVLERLGDRLQVLEERILRAATRSGQRGIHRVRWDLLVLRRAVGPQHEAVAALAREESPLITPTVRQYLRDCLDHAVQILDVIDTYHELASNLMEMHVSSVNQRSNDVMTVLTIMASIFIPLTFLAGLYGMNFDYLPELHYRRAYHTLLAIMGLVALGMLLWFRWLGWLGREGDGAEEED